MQHEINANDSLSHRIQLLGIEDGLQLSVSLGMTEGVRGSANYITQHASNPDDVAVVLKIHIDTKTEQLSTTSLVLEYPEELGEGGWTHFVIGITYYFTKYFYVY